ncbi:MAG: hypothetical protein ABSG40_20520 [Terriglobales bacterium]|jgi:hypothetical protein
MRTRTHSFSTGPWNVEHALDYFPTGTPPARRRLRNDYTPSQDFIGHDSFHDLQARAAAADPAQTCDTEAVRECPARDPASQTDAA